MVQFTSSGSSSATKADYLLPQAMRDVEHGDRIGGMCAACVDETMGAVLKELVEADRKHPGRWFSPHQGYAILLEEVDEAWDAIKRNDKEETRKEMIQVAAMAVRYLLNF